VYERDTDKNKTFLLPRLELTDIEITQLTYEKTEMVVKTLIKNQLPVSFTADSLEYQLFINDKEIMKDHYKKSITLGGNDSSWISLPATLLNQKLFSEIRINDHEHHDSVEYRVHVSFFTRIILRRQFDIDMKKFLPLIHLPVIKPNHFKISSIDFKGARIELSLSVGNPNIFPIKLNNVAYEIMIENNKWVKGTIPGLTDIPAKAASEFTIPVSLTFKEAGKALIDLLKKSAAINYKLRLSFKIVGGNNMIKNSEVMLENNGSVKTLMKIAKRAKKAREQRNNN